MRSLLPRPDLFVIGVRQRIFQTLIQVIRHGEHGRTETDYRTAYTSPEVTYLPGSVQTPTMNVLLIPSQLHIREYLFEPGRADNIARVIRQLVIQRIGTAVAHDRLFREVTEHPSDEQRGYIGLTGTWRHGNGQPANNTILIRIIHTSKSVRHMFQK